MEFPAFPLADSASVTSGWENRPVIVLRALRSLCSIPLLKGQVGRFGHTLFVIFQKAHAFIGL